MNHKEYKKVYLIFTIIALLVLLNLLMLGRYVNGFIKNNISEQLAVKKLVNKVVLRKEKDKAILKYKNYEFLKKKRNNTFLKFYKNNDSFWYNENSVFMLVFGDIMLDRYIRYTIKQHGAYYPFAKVKDLISGTDITLANLEGPITKFEPRDLRPNNTVFTFSPDMATVLSNIGFDIFSLANNHTYDFGIKGYNQTVNFLKRQNILYFGDYYNQKNLSEIIQTNNLKIGFIGFHQLINKNFGKVIEKIKKLNDQVDYVLVYAHWGNEYKQNYSIKQKKQAYKMIDSGADIIIGSHPHVIQPIEVYNNRVIFYSLGNFIFDQTFSKQTQESLAIGIILNQKIVQFFIMPVEIKNLRPYLLKDKKTRMKFFDFLFKNSNVNDKRIVNDLKNGFIKLYY